MNTRVISEIVVSPNGLAFRSDTGEVYRLNPSACEVIGWMREGHDETAVAQLLATRYQRPLQTIRGDLRAFCESLENLQLVERDENH